ncbi:MAG: hypothetical protein OEY49_19345 [Candidatus Heimdallarchaeota archaeon]|nr:hypothetical protein [Candidatus Heimdallarchaeota archaeon]
MISNYKIKLGYKIWLELSDETGNYPIIGEQKIDLLKKIEEEGSINQASQVLDLDFKKAHEMLQDLQDQFRENKLYNTERGRLGGTNLTLLARTIIQTYDLLNSQISNYAELVNTILENADNIQERLKNEIFIQGKLNKVK